MAAMPASHSHSVPRGSGTRRVYPMSSRQATAYRIAPAVNMTAGVTTPETATLPPTSAIADAPYRTPFSSAMAATVASDWSS